MIIYGGGKMSDSITAFQGAVNQATSTETANGTKIVKSGEDLDKNAFLKILTAELSNQDPTNASDGTQYVAQMAQFAGLEQMTNLNSSVKFSNAAQLIGKNVTLSDTDENANQYSGTVKNVTKDGDTIYLNVIVGQEKDSSGNVSDETKKFSIDDVLNISNA